MKNPFRFGQVVTGDSFYYRTQELDCLKRHIFNGYSAWICSPVGCGKTSLILEAFRQLPEVKTIYIDLYNVNSIATFAEKYAQNVVKELFDWKTEIKTVGKKMSQFFKGIIPKVSFDAMGNPSISFEPQAMKEQRDIETILAIPEQIAAQQGFQVCIAFDEFQEVQRIDPFLINWMRSAFQRHQHTSYVFLGSKQSLMETIFAEPNSPFYEFGVKLPIHEINAHDWQVFIKEKFKQTNLEITDATIGAILEKSGGYPHFTQYFASVAWQFIMEGYDQEDPGFADVWMERIIAGQSIVFQNQFDQLNQNQRKTLSAIASLKEDQQLFATATRKRYGLGTSSTLTVTVNALLKRDLITRSNGHYTVLNPVLREWLSRLQG